MDILAKKETAKDASPRRSQRIRAQSHVDVKPNSAKVHDDSISSIGPGHDVPQARTPRKRKIEQALGRRSIVANRSKNAIRSSKAVYAPPSTFAHLSPLTDRLKPGLDVLFCGINPGVESARRGFHFAHPTNHFWRCLHQSGLTDRRLDPSEESLLTTEFNLGLTDLVQRPTAAAAQLSRKDDMIAGVPNLLSKIVQCHPAVVCFVGRVIGDIFCEHAFSPPRKLEAAKSDVWGLRQLKLVYPSSEPQEHESPFKETLLFVIPSTSGANAAYKMSDKVKLLKDLREKLDLIKSGAMDTTEMAVIPFPTP